MRRSMCSSPGNHGSCSRGIVLTYGRRHGGGERHLALGRPLHQPAQQVAGPGLAVGVDDGIEAVQPLRGLDRVDVGQLVDVAVEDHGRQSRSVTDRYAPTPPHHRPKNRREFVALSATTRAFFGGWVGCGDGDARDLHRWCVPGEPGAGGMGVGGGARWGAVRCGRRGGTRRTSGWRSTPCSMRCRPTPGWRTTMAGRSGSRSCRTPPTS